MGVVIKLISRNMKVYLRDVSAVFFSFLSVLIIIMLYAFFLGDMNVRSIEGQVGDIAGIRWLVDSWIMAGILVVNSITVTLAVFGIMIKDKEEHRIDGFLVTPVGRGKLVVGYLFSAWFVGIIMTVFAYVLAEVYIVINGGELLSFVSTLKVLGLIVLNVFSGSAIVFFLVSLIKSTSAFAALSTILGTLIGFITGIYIPVGVLPESIQTLTKFVPATHGSVLMRQVFMEGAAKRVFAGAPAAAMDSFYEAMGGVMYWGDTKISGGVMIAVMVSSALLFLGLSVLVMNRKKS